MATQEKGGKSERAAVDRSPGAPRAGSIGLVLLVALALVGAATGLLFVNRNFAEHYILGLLAILASIGVLAKVPAPWPRRSWTVRSTACW
jgi:two-component system, cell cycle sensor histidine kinase and response regulator CckA